METKAFLESLGDKCRACLDKINARLDEIAKINETSKDEVELKAVADELAELEAEKAEAVAELKEIEAQLNALEPKKEEPKEEPKKEEPPKEEVVVEDDVKVNPERKNFLVFDKRNGGKPQMTIEERKAHAEAFKNTGKMALKAEEVRATLLSGGKIATPTEVNGIVDTFNRVSSIVDLVRVINCEGMGANKVAYEKSISTANTYTEGDAIGQSDPQYDFVTITPTAIGVLSLLSNQVMKQTPLDYEGKIVDSAEKALRVKVASFITAKILASSLLAKPEALELSAIDDKTLRKIALSYGSPEAVYGDAWLFLTKADLIAFGDVRGTNGNKSAVYEITPDTGNPNTGVIKDGGLSVRYCLNPNLTPLAEADADAVSMFYGQPECAELDLFGDYQVKVSEDWAFDKNMLAIRGTAEIGADVIKKDGFVAVTKAGN